MAEAALQKLAFALERIVIFGLEGRREMADAAVLAIDLLAID